MAGVMQALARIEEPGALQPFIEAYRMQSGRPTIFNEIVAAEIVERLTAGETLRSICSSPDMPSNPTVYDWAARSPAFSCALADARRKQATSFAEEAVEILDSGSCESMPHVQRDDKRANLRLQLAKCYDRETYGDKVQQDVNVRGVVIHTDNTALAQLMGSD